MEQMLDDLVRKNKTNEPEAAASEPVTTEATRAFAVAAAVISGRFCSVNRAVTCLGATDLNLKYVERVVDELSKDPIFVAESKKRENRRCDAHVAAAIAAGKVEDRRDDIVWVEAKHAELLKVVSARFSLRAPKGMTSKERCIWRWIFKTTGDDDRRYFA